MERIEIMEKVKLTLSKVLKHDDFELTDTLRASEVEGWDSLTHMRIIYEIERLFDVRFKLKELHKLLNMGDLFDLIESKK